MMHILDIKGRSLDRLDSFLRIDNAGGIARAADIEARRLGNGDSTEIKRIKNTKQALYSRQISEPLCRAGQYPLRPITRGMRRGSRGALITVMLLVFSLEIMAR